MATSEQIGIIGGGLGGLAAACTLAARGYGVTLFEKNQWLGGKATVLECDGFRFDMGPTILTLPSVLRRIFSEAGRSLDDYLDLIPLDPQWRCFYEDGSQLDLVADADAMSRRIEQFSEDGRTAAGYREFQRYAARLHDISERFFFWKSVGSIRDTFRADGLLDRSVLRDLLALRMGRSVAGVVRSHLRDARVAQMADHFTQYVGSAPDNSPAVLCGIAHMQSSEGIWYPRGGLAAVPRALIRLAEELGVRVCLGRGVTRIDTERDRVSAVQLDDGTSEVVSAVVCNSDSVRAHRELLDHPAAKRFARRRRYEPACSGVVLYLGLNQRYDHLLHHNFVFSHDPHEEFAAIYRRGEPAQDPSCYVCAPAASEPEVAPPGGEALYVLVHTPYLHPEHDWPAMLPEYRRTILEKLKRVAGLEDLERRIVVDRVLTPADIETRYHTLKGAIYGLASHGRILGAFKPANRSSDLSGFYLAGGSAHPGPGVPMVLMSGWIAADALDHDQHARGAVAARSDALLQPVGRH